MSVAIVHNFKTLKIKVTPGISSTEILTKATDHFKMDFATTALFHNNNELDLGIPFRLLNLPAGAKLTLNQTSKKRSNKANIKVQLINSPFEKSSVVKKFETSSTIKQVIHDVEKELNVSILGQNFGLKINSLSKAITEDEVESTTLSQLGVGDNGVLRVSFITPFIIDFKEKEEEEEDNLLKNGISVLNEEVKTTYSQTIEENTSVVEKKHNIKDNAELDISPKANNLKAVPQLEEEGEGNKLQPQIFQEQPKQHIYVYKPSSEPILKPITDDASYEVTVDQARQYQNLLAQRAHDTPKLKRLREAAKKHIEITNIEIRIRFPDFSNLQVNFSPNDTNTKLYEFVRGTLDKKHEPFQLVIPHPFKKLEENNDKLVVNLTSRNLLIFESERKSGLFLKREFLEKAQDIKEAEEVRLDLNRHLLNEDEVKPQDEKIRNGILPKNKNVPVSSSDQSSGGKKIPKWLKIGKK